jgi:hypothetical protein
MRCPDSERWIAFYGGETGDSETLRLAAHLDDCECCQKEFDQLCSLGAGIRGAWTATPKLPASRLRPRRLLVRQSSPSWIPMAAAAAIIVAVLLLVMRKEPPEPPIVRAPVAVKEEPSPSPVLPPTEQPPEPAPRTARVPVPEPPKEVVRVTEVPTPSSVVALPEPEALPPEPRTPAPSRPTEVLSAVAMLERCEGEVLAGLVPAKDAQTLYAGRGLSCAGPRSRAVVRFPDGTRMELAEKTVIGALSDRAGAQGVGKWVELSHGSVMIEAAHQAAEHAMVIATPHGEARIVGTTFRLLVEPASTRLEVAEGKVRLTRAGGGAVDVPGGHSALAGPGIELAARPLPRMVAETVLKFSFEDGALPRVFDSGMVERGPERAGSRFCIAAAMTPGSTSSGIVKLSDDGKGLYTYSEDLVLSFDYWADDSVRTLDLHSWSRMQQTTFGLTVWNIPREQWTHLAVPMSDLVHVELERVYRLKPGEAVPNLWITAGQAGAKFYVDNLEILRLRPAPAKKK